MRLSTKGRYAVTAMMDLAIYGSAGPVTLADISQCQDISLSYLEQLFAKLRQAKLVEGVRGPGGGYRLGRPASKISVAEIISAVDEKLDMTQCGGAGNCMEGEKCLTHELWKDLSDRLYEFLDGITLSDFVERPEVQEVARRQSRESLRHHLLFGRFAA